MLIKEEGVLLEIDSTEFILDIKLLTKNYY